MTIHHFYICTEIKSKGKTSTSLRISMTLRWKYEPKMFFCTLSFSNNTDNSVCELATHGKLS